MITWAKSAIWLTFLIAVSGCAHSTRLPECKGKATPINVGATITESKP